MPQLTAADYVILNQYVTNGQRELYWGYLTTKGDTCAVRAGEVARNELPRSFA